MLFKMTDIETSISPKNINIGDIGYHLYTKDENTAFIRIGINQYGERIDLNAIDMTPRLDLLMQDGSILLNQPIDVLMPEKGLLQYNVPENVTKHVGKVNCKLFLESNTKSIHVANFYFEIFDSGIENAVAKEVETNKLQTMINDILKKGNVVGETGSSLKGLTGVFIGDSITEVNFRTTKNYHKFIAERTGLNVVNMGISGTGYQDRRNVAYEIAKQPDFISVFLGTNDWGLVGNKLRELGDADNIQNGTVASNIYYLYKQLTERYPYTPIVVLTPLPRIECNPNNEVANKAGYTLGELVEVIKKIASSFSLPVLDLYHNSNLKVWDYNVNKEMFAYEPGKEDGLHPNAKGHEFISYSIQSFYEEYAIVKPKILYNLNRPETETLSNGAKVTYAIPYQIYWKKNQSMIMNFKTSEIDLTNKKVLKIESNGGALINSNGVSVNSPYYVTNTQFNDGTQYNRTSEVEKFMKTLKEVDYSSGRGYEYLPQLFKITYVDAKSNLTGSYSKDDGIDIVQPSYKPSEDVDSPTYRTPKSDKPDEVLKDGKIATYLYPKRIFWIKGQSFAINFDPFDKDFEEVYISSIEYKDAKIGIPNSVSVNTPAYYQVKDFDDGTTYNRLSEITKFTKNLPIASSSESRIDYEQVELKVTYSKTPLNTSGSTAPTGSTQPITPTDNKDGTYSVTLTPTKISWKEDQSFLINFNPSAISLSGKQVVKLEANGKTLKNASSTQDGYFFWYTVPTYDSLSSFNRTSEVKDFVGSLTLDTTGSDGKKVYKNIEMKITYK